MSNPAARKLKVFQAQFGFHDSVVAAPSQAAALRAWGTRQNLFAEGLARIATDEASINAALGHPETPLRRAIGSKAPFELDSASVPKLPVRSKLICAGPVRKRDVEPAPKPPADRTALNAAEKALRELDRRRERDERALQQRLDALEIEMNEAGEAYRAQRKAASDAIAAIGRAYRMAGGED